MGVQTSVGNRFVTFFQKTLGRQNGSGRERSRETKTGKEGNERGRGVEEGERILLILPLSKLPEKR